jgi:hypothetical protein
LRDGRWAGKTQQPSAKAGGLVLRTESPDARRLNDASQSGSILKSSVATVGWVE